MYAFLFMDGTWRVDVKTSMSHLRPEPGTKARALFDRVYDTRPEAEQAIRDIRGLSIRNLMS